MGLLPTLSTTWGAGLHLFATLNPNDRLLGKLYPRIAEETGFSNDIQGRRAYVAERCATYSQAKSM